LTINIPYALAHPFTEETNPSSSVNAPEGITEVYVRYSEPIEIEFSSLKVFDSSGDQIDNKDTKYFESEASLIVTTPPLEEGVYTVTSKVLSKVDGHLVDDAFIFGVGDIQLESTEVDPSAKSETLFLPEAAARFPGLVGQTIILGGVIASLAIWGTQNKDLIKNEIKKVDSFYHGRFMSITGIGLMLVFGSNIAMLAVQSFRLETSAIDAIQTTFGTMWLVRMVFTIMLLGIWFWMDRKEKLSKAVQIPMLVVSLLLIGTSSMIGHGAASEETGAIALDYIHNLVASVWIGGIFYFVFILLPSFSELEGSKKERLSLVMIPRFSIAFIVAIGIVIISGPTLLWFLESDVSLITDSTYGKLILAKIAIASLMVALGGYFQLNLQRKGEKLLKSNSILIHKKLRRSLKFDAALGVLLLGVVALLANGSLPAGEIQKVEAQEELYSFRTIEFTENTKFDIDISPFTTGTNLIFVKVSNLENKPLYDFSDLKIKISNPTRNISPIEVPIEKLETGEDRPMEFKGEITFGFSGNWQLEVEAQRTENANESVMLDLLVKPRLQDLKVEIVEYDFPEGTNPLYPLYDGDNYIWISDSSAPKLWRFDLETKELEPFEFDGGISMILTIDNEGNIWFTDRVGDQIGYFNPKSEQFTTIALPDLSPIEIDNTPTFIEADYDGNIWVAITSKDIILKYDTQSQSFDQIRLPEEQSIPYALAADNEGNLWFTESGKGRIGYINTETNEVEEISPDTPLVSPEELLFDREGNIWIAEHTGLAITKFNRVLETFETVTIPNEEALPFGMSFDRYGNIWIAQHTVDTIAVYDPDNENLIEVEIPTQTSFVQFTTTDGDDNVWFAEQRGEKIGMVKITEVPSTATPILLEEEIELKYTEIVSPLMALGIIATSLFFVKNVKDKRRLNELINS